MLKHPSSCSYAIQTDVPKSDLMLIYGESLSYQYEDKHSSVALNHVTFGAEQGKITAIIGESGSGKSTLLRLISGLLAPSEGEIRYKGLRIQGPHEKLIPGHPDMRLVSQRFDDLNTYAKAWDNIASRLSNTDIESKQAKTQRILKMLEIEHRAQHRVFDLSGGEQQRVAIARALVDDAQVLLLDEPFNQVDASFRERLQETIRKIVHDTGLTVIMVSHDPEEVMAMADHLLILRNGELLASGKPEDLYHAPTNIYTAQLLAKSNVLSQEDASYLKINSKSPICIHPEWIAISDHTGITAHVSATRFKGFYEELILSIKGIELKAINPTPKKYAIGKDILINITHYHPLSE